MIDLSIEKLVNYALNKGLIEESDRVWAENALLSALHLDSFTHPDETENAELEPILAELIAYGVEPALQLVGKGTELMFTRKGISETVRFTPEKVMEDVKMVSCGFRHAGILEKNGCLWMYGDNSDGQFGNGSKKSRYKQPVRVRPAS